MLNIAKALCALSCVAFVIAIISVLFNVSFIGTSPEGYSRVCNNLALIAIALAVCFKTEKKIDTS
jgi:hypothetical protein